VSTATSSTTPNPATSAAANSTKPNRTTPPAAAAVTPGAAHDATTDSGGVTVKHASKTAAALAVATTSVAVTTALSVPAWPRPALRATAAGVSAV